LVLREPVLIAHRSALFWRAIMRLSGQRASLIAR